MERLLLGVGFGIFDFAVFSILDRCFGFCAKKRRLFGFCVHCVLRIFRFIAFVFNCHQKY